MSHAGQGALPGLVAEQAIQKIRGLFSAPALAPGERLWSLLTLGERRAMLRRAARDVELSRCDWSALATGDQSAILAAWVAMRERVMWLAAKVAR